MLKSEVERLQNLPQGGVGEAFEGYIDKKECARRLGRTPRSLDNFL
jgi:hypothetical protein